MKSVYRPKTCYMMYNVTFGIDPNDTSRDSQNYTYICSIDTLVIPLNPVQSACRASDLLSWVHIPRPMLMIFNMCCYKLYIYIHTSLQCLHNNNVPEIRFFYLKKYMLQYSISFYYIVTYCMCLFISSCVPVRCGSVPAGWVCPYRNTINTTMLNYWNIPEHQWAPANVELSWDGPHHSAGPPHTSIDLTKVTYTHRLSVLHKMFIIVSVGFVNIHINDEESLCFFSYQIKICICEFSFGSCAVIPERNLVDIFTHL